MGRVKFNGEQELEDFVFKNLDPHFSEHRIFIPEKKRIKTAGGKETLPDGILLDFEREKVYLIENELKEHDVFSHIAPQILKFLIAYKNNETKLKLRDIFVEEIKKNKKKFMNIFEKYKDFDILDIHPKIEEFLNSELGLFIYIDGISEDLKDFCEILNDHIKEIWLVEVLKFEKDGKTFITFNKDEDLSFDENEAAPIKRKGKGEKYVKIFRELLERFKAARPGITEKKPRITTHLGVPLGIGKFHVEWLFRGREPKKELEVGFHFEKNDGLINHLIFDFFKSKKSELEELFQDDEIIFQKQWYKKGIWSKIYIMKEIETLEDFLNNNELKDWAVDNLLKFFDFYKKYSDIVEIKVKA